MAPIVVCVFLDSSVVLLHTSCFALVIFQRWGVISTLNVVFLLPQKAGAVRQELAKLKKQAA